MVHVLHFAFLYVLEARELYVWGDNTDGFLLSSFPDTAIPVPIKVPLKVKNAVSVTCGRQTVFVVTGYHILYFLLNSCLQLMAMYWLGDLVKISY